MERGRRGRERWIESGERRGRRRGRRRKEATFVLVLVAHITQ